jgi:IMP dehydrogenase
VVEGVEGYVPFKGDLSTVVQELIAGLKTAMGYAGAKNIEELRTKARFVALTPSGLEEAKPHDVLLPGEG